MAIANHLQQRVVLCNEKVARGAMQAEIAAYLHDLSPHPLEAIMVMRELYGLDLREALEVISNNSSWEKEAKHILS